MSSPSARASRLRAEWAAVVARAADDLRVGAAEGPVDRVAPAAAQQEDAEQIVLRYLPEESQELEYEFSFSARIEMEGGMGGGRRPGGGRPEGVRGGGPGGPGGPGGRGGPPGLRAATGRIMFWRGS